MQAFGYIDSQPDTGTSIVLLNRVRWPVTYTYVVYVYELGTLTNRLMVSLKIDLI